MDHCLHSRQEEDVYKMALQNANESFLDICNYGMDKCIREMILRLIESEEYEE